MTINRYPFDGLYFLLVISQSAFDSLTADQKRDLKQFVMEVGLRERVDSDSDDADEVADNVTHLPRRMTQVRLPVVGPKRFALVEATLGDPADSARELTLAQAKAKFVAKLANKFGRSVEDVNNAMTFTVFGVDWESSRLGARAHLAANAAMWGQGEVLVAQLATEDNIGLNTEADEPLGVE